METNPTSTRAEIQSGSGSLPHLIPSYITVGALGMFLWDLMVHLSTEHELLLKQQIRLITIMYFWARMNTLLVLVCYTTLFTAPLNEYCPVVAKLTFIAVPPLAFSTSLLIFLRVRALYPENRTFIITLFLSLLAVVGTSALMPFAGAADKITPDSSYCTFTRMRGEFFGAIITTEFIYNAVSFLAISIKLMSQNAEEVSLVLEWGNLRRFLRGKHLLGLSRTLWQDGQKFILVYLTTTSINVVIQAVVRIPEPYGCALVTIHFALNNTMSSYLIRSIRSSALRQDLNIPTTLDLRTQPDVSDRGGNSVAMDVRSN